MTNLTTLIDEELPKSDGDIVIDQATLNSVFSRLLGEEAASSYSSFYTDAVLRLLGKNSAELRARSGGWNFHIGRNLVQTSVSGVFMAIMLKSVAATPISLAIIPAILPYLFQVDKTQLTMKDEEILLHLHQVVRSKSTTANELYESMPEEIRGQVNQLDLLDFLDAMTKTGHAKEVARGVFQLRHPDHPRFVINFA